ncbi:hypothetical protein KI387_037969, partial [Taxus chinensis]
MAVLGGTCNALREEDNMLCSMENDEEGLKCAALEKLPTYDGLRKSLLNQFAASRSFRYAKVAEVNNQQFLSKFRQRIDRVGIQLPAIEVRFAHLNIYASAHVGSRSLPTLTNFTSNLFE